MYKPLSVLRADEAAGVNGAAAGKSEQGARAAPIRKRDIPTPIIATVPGYEAEQYGDFRVPDGYIRFPRRTSGEDDVTTCEYCLEMEDEEWLDEHPRYGLAVTANSQKEKLLDADKLEEMLGILEMATGQADPVPLPQAETLFVSKLGMSKAMHHDVWNEVYRYWKEKRSRMGKPLLRRFWPVTPSNDTDPHKVFRPREKERYKLRKHRKNDLDSFRKLQQVKKDFEKLLSITRMIQKREMMKREQLLVQQEIFLQQHWDLTDTTGESRPLGIEPGKYKARPRQPAAAAASAAASAGGSVGAGAVAGPTAPAVVQPFERVREERDRPSSRKSKKRKERERSSRASGAGSGEASGGAGGGARGDNHFGAGNAEGADGSYSTAAGGGVGGGVVGDGGISSGIIPGSHITILPSFMDDLKTRANVPVRTMVEPALAVYTALGRGGKGKSGGGGGGGGGGGARERDKSGGRGKARVGVEPVYKFRLRGRIGRGGRVIWDRVPVKGSLPAREDGLADPEEAPLVVHSSYVQFPLKPPSAHVLHPPMVNLNADERRYREICAMDDDQDEMLEPLGLGLSPESSSAQSSSSAAPGAAGGASAAAGAAASTAGGGGGSGGGDPRASSAPKIKYAIEV